MSGVAFDLPDDVATVRDGVLRFVEAQIAPRIERNRSLLEDQRRLYDESGCYAPEVRALIRDIRMLSAEAGFYAMSRRAFGRSGWPRPAIPPRC